MKWVRITAASNIPLREGRAVTVAGHEIAVFNLGDRFVALSNRCPHQGGPLADGIVSGSRVVCPLHGWNVCLSSGGVMRPQASACVETYPVKVEQDIVSIRIPRAREAAA